MKTKIDVLDTQGKVVEKISLPEEIFAAKVNEKLVAQAVRVYLFNQRQGTASTKTRGEVKGSRRKIWRQKGTGRARHGDRYAPIFVGGGVAHGPRPRDFSLKLPKKMKRRALFSALSAKLKEKGIMVVKGLEKIRPKTKEMVKVMKNLALKMEDSKLRDKVLLVFTKKGENIILAGRNLENLTLCQVNLLNAYKVLACEKIIFTKRAVSLLEETFLKR